MDKEAKAVRARIRAKAWRLANPERYRENQARWQEQHKEETRVYNATYRAANREWLRQKLTAKRLADPAAFKAIHNRRYKNPKYAEQMKARTRKWKKANLARATAARLAWIKANPERSRKIALAGAHNRRARFLAAGRLGVEDIQTVRDRGICAICGRTDGKMEVDHKVSLSRGGTNDLLNLQLLCRPCNRSKWAKDQTTWMAERAQPMPP